MPCIAVQYCAVQCTEVQCSTVQCSAVQCSVVQYSAASVRQHQPMVLLVGQHSGGILMVRNTDTQEEEETQYISLVSHF